MRNPGDLSGFAAVKPGTKVWLMIYFTIDQLPRSETRTTTYTVLYQGRTLYQVTFKGKEAASDRGRFSRYAPYTIPVNAPYGAYVYHATISFGSGLRSRSWHFEVAKRNRIVTTATRF